MNKISFNILSVILLLFFCSPALAKTYWISPTGAAANLTACSGSSPLNGTSACSYDKANGSGIVAGDTVYYRGGSYNLAAGADAINPANSGSAGNPIHYMNYNDEDVIFNAAGTGTQHGINLNCDPTRGGSANKRAYIHVHGSPGHPIVFNNFYKWAWLLDTDHNEISYFTFEGFSAVAMEWAGMYIYRTSEYNWIHHGTLHKYGACAPYGTDAGGPFQLGTDGSPTGNNPRYNLIENMDMSAGGHHVAFLGGSNNIYRNNYFHNEPWCGPSSEFSTRVLIQYGYTPSGMYNLNESNRIGYGGPKNKSEVGGNVAQVMGTANIWRYNVWAQSYLSAIWLYEYNDAGEAPTQYNKIYNNTFWKGGYGYYQDYYDPRATAPTNSFSKALHHPVNIENDTAVVNNTFKNNLFYQNNTSGTYTLGSYYDFVTSEYDSYRSVGPDRQIITNNWLDSMGDPKFVDISGTPDPTNGSQWNFNLQSSSPAINGGTYLAMANGAGSNATTLVLNTAVEPYPAAYFFYDKGNFATAFPAANVNNDWIAIGTTNNVVQISSINYTTNTITLASPMTWADNAPIWLYKKSDGTRVLHGSAPDIGAYEYYFHDLTVAKSGPGTGTVTSSPSGISCGSTCSATYPSGTEVTVTAIPSGNSAFTGWEGACAGTGTCKVTMDASKYVKAEFTAPTNSNLLSISQSGTGTGMISSSPSGISCGSTCSATYASGTEITLTATPSSSSTFTGWGGACAGTSACTVSMDASKSVTAQFRLNSDDGGSSTSGDGGGGSSCFIATAVYGSYLDYHVQVLRDFRNKYLLSNDIGKAFVHYYYRYSPPVADFLKKHENFRTAMRWVLTPVVWCIEYPYVNVILLILPVGIVVWKRRDKGKGSR